MMDEKRIDKLINKALQEDLALPEGLSERLERQINLLAHDKKLARSARLRPFYWISGVAAAIFGTLFLFRHGRYLYRSGRGGSRSPKRLGVHVQELEHRPRASP